MAKPNLCERLLPFVWDPDFGNYAIHNQDKQAEEIMWFKNKYFKFIVYTFNASIIDGLAVALDCYSANST